VFLEDPGLGLSLFRADIQTPRGVIQHGIDSALQKLSSDDENLRRNGEKQLAKYGSTVEEWLQNGWRVVRLPVSAFENKGYELTDPEPYGHLNAFGDHSSHALALLDDAVEVPRDQF
jgi:hypothetical protein